MELKTPLFKRFLKYKNKYCETDKSDFNITNDRKISYKGVVFWKFDEVDLIGFWDLTDEEQHDFLNSIWNYYFNMMD